MLVYLHGFNSSALSTKARLMGEYLAQRGLAHRYASPSLPHQPKEAIAMAAAAMAGHDGREVCFIGSSLGGFYATYLAEKYDARAVLINPAIDPHIGLRPFLGPQSNLYTGEKYGLTEAHLREWEKLCVSKIMPKRYLLLVETGDEVLDYHQAVNFYAGARQVVVEGGNHSLQSFPEQLPVLLEFAGIHFA